MDRRIFFPALAAAALLSGCEGRIGPGAGNEGGNASATVSAEGKSEEGQFTIKGPGVDLSLNIPQQMRRHTNVDGDNSIMPPGASVSGLHVEAGEGQGNGAVELRFTSSQSPQQVAAWYRDPARASDFSVGNVARQGDAIVISGTAKGENNPFTAQLRAGQSGGTDGRLSITDRSR